jgi:hypothetical protein
MPAFLVPLYEFNPCHNPSGGAGGQFCSTGAASAGKRTKSGKAITFVPVPSDRYDATKVKTVLGLSEAQAEDLATQMVQSLPGEVTVKVRTAHERVYIHATSSEGIDMMRIFTRDADGVLVVTHDYFELPRDLQGEGVAKDALADAVAAYDKLGVNRIALLANSHVGGYAWAKFGFTADSPLELARALTSRLKQFPAPGVRSFGDLPYAEHTRLLKLIEEHKHDPKLPWHIAQTMVGDRHVGKELLLNARWDGTLVLQDAEQRQKFNSYTTSKKQAS